MPSVATRRWDTKAPSTLKRNTPGRWPIEQPHTCPPQGVHSRSRVKFGSRLTTNSATSRPGRDKMRATKLVSVSVALCAVVVGADNASAGGVNVPTVNVPRVNVPKPTVVPKVNVPRVNVNAPGVTVARVTVARVNVNAPGVTVPRVNVNTAVSSSTPHGPDFVNSVLKSGGLSSSGSTGGVNPRVGGAGGGGSSSGSGG